MHILVHFPFKSSLAITQVTSTKNSLTTNERPKSIQVQRAMNRFTCILKDLHKYSKSENKLESIADKHHRGYFSFQVSIATRISDKQWNEHFSTITYTWQALQTLPVRSAWRALPIYTMYPYLTGNNNMLRQPDTRRWETGSVRRWKTNTTDLGRNNSGVMSLSRNSFRQVSRLRDLWLLLQEGAGFPWLKGL